MEEDESGGSACNSSDGGSKSWPRSPSYEPTQLVHSREGLQFLPLGLWPSGGYGRMGVTQLLSNDFYTGAISRQKEEDSEEESEGDEDEEEDDFGVQRQCRQVGVDGEAEGSQSDYEGVYEETQLLEHYNSGHFSKTELEPKIRPRGASEVIGFIDDNRESLVVDEDNYEETQLLVQYGSDCYDKTDYEKGRLMQLPLDMGRNTGNLRGCRSWQQKQVDSDAETADEDEPMETLDSAASTEVQANAANALRQDQQEMPFGEKPKSELSRDQMCEFDMDLNVSLEEMDCEYYEEPSNCNTQLVTNSDTMCPGYYRDTQLVTTNQKVYHDNVSYHEGKPVLTTVKEASLDRWGNDTRVFTNGARFSEAVLITNPKTSGLMKSGETQILETNIHIGRSDSSPVHLPSITSGITLLEKPSVSEASESTPFQSIIGSVRAESIRRAAMKPITWHPKVKLDNVTVFNAGGLQSSKNQREGNGSINSGDLPWQDSTEPEWMRKHGGSGKSISRNLLDLRSGLVGASSTLYIPPSWLDKGDTGNGTGGSCPGKVSDMRGNCHQKLTSGMKPLSDSYTFPRTGSAGSAVKPAGKNGSSLQLRRSYGTGLSSPTCSLNYLDSGEPGEEVQAQALDMVDKLVWLNTNEVPEDSPPKRAKKVFPGLPLASSVMANDPALRVYEFEDIPQEDPAQRFGDMSLIKEIQAGWKKKADQGHLFSTLRKGKEKEATLLPEGERLSKLLTEENRQIIHDPQGLPNVSSRKRISTRLQDKGKEHVDTGLVNEQCAESKNEAPAHESGEIGGKLKVPEGLNDAVVNEGGSGVKQGREMQGDKAENLAGQDMVQEVADEGKGSVAAFILTRRRTQGRNRREHIRVPEMLFLTEKCSSLERVISTGSELDKSPNTSRKRKSLNIMLREQRTHKAKRNGDKDVESQSDVNKKLETFPSNLSTEFGSMLGVNVNFVTSMQKRALEVDVEAGSSEKGRKRIKFSETSDANLLVVDDEAGEQAKEGVKTRSLRHLPRRCNGNDPTEFVNGIICKRLRSVRRGPGGGKEGPISANQGNESDLNNDDQEEASTSPLSATSNGTDKDGELEVDDISSPVKGGECSRPRSSQFILPHADDGRMNRTRSVADVSTPTKPNLVPHPIPFPLVTGKRGRGAVVKPENMDETHFQYPTPPFVVPASGGKGQRMRSARKRKESLLNLASGNFLESCREESASASTEGSAQTQQSIATRVLFSHGLSEVTVKRQRKILESLDGKVAMKAADCTHFVAEKFVRTGNMLEAMAAGKFVVTFGWLESCEIENCFVDESSFILEDEKKENDLDFSMCDTLQAAQEKPLLQGVRVLLTPNISPKPQAIAAIVHAAGGQVVEEYEGPSPDTNTEDFCIVISCEEDINTCAPLLEQGAKVYKSELILSGIVSYCLDFSKFSLRSVHHLILRTLLINTSHLQDTYSLKVTESEGGDVELCGRPKLELKLSFGVEVPVNTSFERVH